MGKRDTDLDWTIDDSPADRQAEPRSAHIGLRGAQRAIRVAAPRQPSVFRRHRRWLLPLAGALAALALGVYAVYWLGWQRVRASLTEQIVYEDTHSAAGDVDAVLAVQAAGDDAWLAWRAAQVRLGLASLAPAESLTPLARAPRLLRLDVRDTGRFEAVVLRDFADPSGQSYTFEYRQRFHQLAPGVWESLPPDTASLTETRQWRGLRLNATYPLADERWMLAALPKIDGYLQAACIDWQCPAGSVAPVVFQGRLPALSGAGAAAAAQRYRAPLSLSSLQLAGYPHDAAATQALSRAITSRLLEQLAVDIAAANRYARMPYLDALVARAEIRLKLTPELAEPLRPSTFAGPTQLWPVPAAGQLAENNQGPRPRQQALRFLNDLLSRFPPSAEAALLRQAGRASSLANWLSEGLDIDGQAAIDDWTKNAASQMAASFPAHWEELRGLAYVCPAGAWLVRGGQPEQLPIDAANTWLPRAAVSPDGHWLAAASLNAADVTLIDLSTTPVGGIQLPAAPGQQTWPLGWMPDGRLAMANNPQFQFLFGVDYQFELLDPATTITSPLGSLLLVPQNWPRGQPALNGKLAINVVQVTSPLVAFPAVVTLASPLVLHVPVDPTLSEAPPPEQAPPAPVFSQALSPDGRWLAYQPAEAAPAGVPWPPAHLMLFDTLTRQSLEVLISESVADGELLHDATALTWLPDGSGLIFIVSTGDARTRLMRLTLDPNNPAAGADASEIPTPFSIAYLAGISSDNRYLAAAVPTTSPMELLVLDLTTHQVVERAAIGPGAILGGVWSPSGHQLAVQGPAGLYVIDPASGQQQWVAGGLCQPAWYGLNASAP